ncbi:hypothetical protein D3C87_1481580 [compost metagenome]
MCLAGAGKGVEQVARLGGLLAGICIRQLNRSQVLNLRIQCKVNGWGNIKFIQCIFYCGLQISIHHFIIVKLYFLLGRMHIDINLAGINLQE